MQSSNFFDTIMELGLYSLWLIPVFGVYAYFRIFIDRYSIALRNSQVSFENRMLQEADIRRARANMSQMAEDMNIDLENQETIDLRGMDPAERIVYCLEKGMILNLPVPIGNLKPGQILGADAVNSHGDVLLVRGSYLTKDSINQISRMGVDSLSIMFHPEHSQAKRLLG